MIATRYLLSLLGAAFLTLPRPSFADDMALVWKWKKPGHELYGPAFHPGGDKIAIVIKLNWPDGHDAESYPDSHFRSLEKQKKANPRFADPTVVVLENRGSVEKRIDWGWDPAYSADGRLLAYAFQKNPSSGFRVLAKT